MRSRNIYNPTDYNVTANPSLRETNAPWRFFAALVVAALTFFGAWHYFQGPVRVSLPTLEFAASGITATTFATNDTADPVRLSLRIAVDRGKSRFGEELASQIVEVLVYPHSVEPVRCEFPVPPGTGPVEARPR